MINSKSASFFNMDNMEKYFQDYDVLYQKYFWSMDTQIVPQELFKQAIALEDCHVVLDRMWDIEKAQEAFLAVEKIYDDDTLKHLGIIQLANDKFIGNFVGIEGIDRLFRDSYFDFEWMMHLEYNRDKQDYSYYRDHYIHQIKNMYEMLVLLDEHGFMEKCIEVYKRSTGLVAQYIRRSVREQVRGAEQAERQLFESIVDGENKKRGSNGGVKSYSQVNLAEIVNQKIEEYCYRYILHSAAIIAALVHDIGYPIAYMFRTTKTLHKFLPLSEAFIHINDAMPHLEEILQESLLYKTTNTNQIAKRIKDKQNHGAISAVILLSQYYESGAIYHLRPIERMAIELAALVIYNHTLHYGYITKEKEEIYRNIFDENPLSYLFRLCDDIQEWGRVYFDISKKSNFMICPDCHMPITKSPVCIDYRDGVHYTCVCGTRIDKQTEFTYRKLTHITACKAVSICDIQNGKEIEAGKIYPFTIKMEYDLVTLLQLSYYSPRFAKQRADGIYEVKRMLDDQYSLPSIYVDTFLTNNPIAIKVRCLEQYLEQMQTKLYKIRDKAWNESMDAYISDIKVKNNKEEHGKAHRERAKKQLNQYLNNIKDSKGRRWRNIKVALMVQNVWEKLYGYDFDQADHDYIAKASEKLLTKLQQNLYFYLYLAVIGNAVETWRKKGNALTREESIELTKLLAIDIADLYKIQDRPTKVLIMDFLLLRWRHISRDELLQNKEPEIKQSYYEMGLSNKFMVNMVNEYVGNGIYEKVKASISENSTEDLEGIYDFYTDYELFARMAKYKDTES